jgi:F-type H+-transporting ATPase subunit gamma
MQEIREEDSAQVVFYAVGRRGASSVEFRGLTLADSFTGFTDRPSYSDAREVADSLISAYVDGELDRVEMFYNGYISPMSQEVRHETLLPLQQADVLGDDGEEDEESGGSSDGESEGPDQSRSLWIYEPDPEEILRRLAPDYVEISIYRAMLESTASEHGARMTAMRSASDNAADLIDDLTLEANRQRQADITQEIMEVVAGAEGLR